MKSHTTARRLLSAFAIVPSLVAWPISPRATAASAAPSSPQELLRELASAPPDDCSLGTPSASTPDVHQLEDLLFRAVDQLVADRLNEHTASEATTASSRARSALIEVEQASSELNKDWPENNRFHFDVFVVPPVMLLRTTFRDEARLVLFGFYYLNKYAAVDPGVRWREIGLADLDSRASSIDLYPLHQGPAGRARFLARVWRSGCAGSIGEGYYGYEWSAEIGQLATPIIKINGAEGLDDTASKHVGALDQPAF